MTNLVRRPLHLFTHHLCASPNVSPLTSYNSSTETEALKIWDERDEIPRVFGDAKLNLEDFSGSAIESRLQLWSTRAGRQHLSLYF